MPRCPAITMMFRVNFKRKKFSPCMYKYLLYSYANAFYPTLLLMLTNARANECMSCRYVCVC